MHKEERPIANIRNFRSLVSIVHSLSALPHRSAPACTLHCMHPPTIIYCVGTPSPIYQSDRGDEHDPLARAPPAALPEVASQVSSGVIQRFRVVACWEMVVMRSPSRRKFYRLHHSFRSVDGSAHHSAVIIHQFNERARR